MKVNIKNLINVKSILLSVFVIGLVVAICILSKNYYNTKKAYTCCQKEYDELYLANIDLKEKYDDLCNVKVENTELNKKISSQTEEISKLEAENANLKKQINSNTASKSSNKASGSNKTNSNKTNSTTNNTNTNNSTPSVATKGNYGSKKTYMYYTSITNKRSAQWKVQQRATTNKWGVRVVREDGREYACIAIGTGWNYLVGTKVFVKTTNGGYYAIIGDIKGNSATTANHLKGKDGSITEFIVDKNLNSNAKRMGNLNVIPAYSGDVLNITKV